MGIKVVYIIGPYRASTRKQRDRNIANAGFVAVELWKRGFVPLCPHTNSGGMEDAGISDEVILSGDLELLSRCDAAVVIDGYERSTGSLAEIKHCEEQGMPVFYWPECPKENKELTVVESTDNILTLKEEVMPEIKSVLKSSQEYRCALCNKTIASGTAHTVHHKNRTARHVHTVCLEREGRKVT